MKLFSIILGSIVLICLLFLGVRFILNLKRPLKLSDTHFLLDRLYEINSPDAFLTITIAGSDDFIQMQLFNKNELEIDFPMITERQRTHEDAVKSLCIQKGLPVTERFGTDGSRFLDVLAVGDAGSNSEILMDFFKALFGAGENSKISFNLSRG